MILLNFSLWMTKHTFIKPHFHSLPRDLNLIYNKCSIYIYIYVHIHYRVIHYRVTSIEICRLSMLWWQKPIRDRLLLWYYKWFKGHFSYQKMSYVVIKKWWVDILRVDIVDVPYKSRHFRSWYSVNWYCGSWHWACITILRFQGPQMRVPVCMGASTN